MNFWRIIGKAALLASALWLMSGASFAQVSGECLNAPVLFSDDGYRGRSLVLTDSNPNIHAQGMGDDASSVCVPYGWRVVLYEDSNYGGQYLELAGPAQISDLKRERPDGVNWGDRISSVKVFKPVVRNRGGRTIECRQVTLYSNDDFGGRSVTAQSSIADLHRVGMGDDASSVCVPAGFKVELFEHTNYRGSRLEVRGPDSIADLKRDRPDGADWGDRISSIRVSKDSGYGVPPVRRGRVYDPTPSPTVRCDRYPTLYEHGNYSGRAMELSNSAPNLQGQSFNDIASSVCVPQGWRVVLYSESDYRGESLTLNGPEDNPDLGRLWNDRVSSVQVYPPGRGIGGIWRNPDDIQYGPPPAECGQYPTLFADSGFRGQPLRLDNSIADLHRVGMGDKASSICVPSGWIVTLYSDTNYRGSTLEIRGDANYNDLSADRPDGSDWGDRVSSVRVDRSWRR